MSEQQHDNILDTLKDIRHSCEVIDGKRKLDDHKRNQSTLHDLMGTLGMDVGDILGGGK